LFDEPRARGREDETGYDGIIALRRKYQSVIKIATGVTEVQLSSLLLRNRIVALLIKPRKRVRTAMKTPGRSRSLRVALLWIVFPGTTLSPLSTALCQQPTPSSNSKQTDGKSDSAPAKTPLTAEEQKRADLLADTEKLYKLTQELKVEVDKSNRNTLSVSVVKKAQEIERLAKSIKERGRPAR
jgi:hypothetical protein